MQNFIFEKQFSKVNYVSISKNELDNIQIKKSFLIVIKFIFIFLFTYFIILIKLFLYFNGFYFKKYYI